MRKLFPIALISICLIITGCGKKEKEAPGQEGVAKHNAGEAANPDMVKQKVLAFDLEVLSDRGEKKWDVRGRSAEAITENRIKLNNIVARSYGEGSEATITGDDGVYDRLNNNVKLENNVKAVIENTENFSKDFMSLPLTPPESNGTGADKPKKTKTVITCDGNAVFDYQNNKAYFNRNVKVLSDDANIDADKITVNLDMATKKVKEIVAEGNVKITRGENITYSDSATFIEEDKSVILSGRPRLILCQEGDIAKNILGNTGK